MHVMNKRLVLMSGVDNTIVVRVVGLSPSTDHSSLCGKVHNILQRMGV